MSETNFKIFARVRPMLYTECEDGFRSFNEIEGENLFYLHRDRCDSTPKCFSFFHIFNEDATQRDVFDTIVKPMLFDFFHGYNGTIFTYGSIGTGKTYTLEGNPDIPNERGIIPRIFAEISSAGLSTYLQMYFYEIYDNKINNLIDDDNNRAKSNNSFSGKTDASELRALTGPMNILLQAYARGSCARLHTQIPGSPRSSLSHLVLELNLRGAKFMIVDLAGTSRLVEVKSLRQSLYSGEVAQENLSKEGESVSSISKQNLSLLALGNVVNAIVTRAKHVPYLDCQLTKSLQTALGGNSKVAAIMCLSPSPSGYLGNLSACAFAVRAKQIKNKYVQQVADPRDTLIMALRTQIDELTAAISAKKQEISENTENFSFSERNGENFPQNSPQNFPQNSPQNFSGNFSENSDGSQVPESIAKENAQYQIEYDGLSRLIDLRELEVRKAMRENAQMMVQREELRKKIHLERTMRLKEEDFQRHVSRAEQKIEAKRQAIKNNQRKTTYASFLAALLKSKQQPRTPDGKLRSDQITDDNNQLVQKQRLQNPQNLELFGSRAEKSGQLAQSTSSKALPLKGPLAGVQLANSTIPEPDEEEQNTARRDKVRSQMASLFSVNSQNT